MAKKQTQQSTSELLNQLRELDQQRAELVEQIYGKKSQGDFMISLRTDLGMSQRGFARATGLSQPFVNQVEHGHRTMSVDRLSSITKALHYEGGSTSGNDQDT